MAYYKNYRNYPTYQKKEKTYKSYLHLSYKEICDREKYFLDRIKALHSLWNEFIDYFAEHNDKVEKATDYLIEKIKKHLKLKKFNKDIKFALQRIKELEFEIEKYVNSGFVKTVFTSEKKAILPFLKINNLYEDYIAKYDKKLIDEIEDYLNSTIPYSEYKKLKFKKKIELSKNNKNQSFEINTDKYDYFVGKTIDKKPNEDEYIKLRQTPSISTLKNNKFKSYYYQISPFEKYERNSSDLGYHLENYFNINLDEIYKSFSEEFIIFLNTLTLYPSDSGFSLFNILDSSCYDKIKEIEEYLKPIQKAKSIIEKRHKEQQSKIKRAKDETAKHKAHSYAYQDKTRELAEEIKKEIKSQLRKLKICPYCENDLGKIPHADHIYPVSKGGLSTKENMVYICQSCNSSKSNKTLNVFIKSKGFDRDKVESNLELLGKDY